jgi:hypothetical protein
VRSRCALLKALERSRGEILEGKGSEKKKGTWTWAAE